MSFVLAFALASLASDAVAQEGDDESDPVATDAPSEPPEQPEKKKDKEKKKKKKKAVQSADEADAVTVSGRVFVRSTATKTIFMGAQWRNEYDVSSARAGLDVRKYGWLRGSLEVEFAQNDLELKDVYVRARVHRDVTVQAGFFKRPMSPIALSSIWDLPLVERGILSSRITTANYLVPLNLGGRSAGAMVTYRSKKGVKPRVDVGLFNANLPKRASGGAELADQADNLLRDVYVRSEIEPIDGFTVGGSLAAFTQARFADKLRTRLMGSLDVTLDTKHFRAWLEGFAGRTPFFDGTESKGGFLALRVLVAGRFPKPTSWLSSVEPFAVISTLDPTDEKQDNQTTEIGAGVTAYFRKAVRLQLEYSRTINEDEFPQSDFSILDVHTVRLQLGARFR